MQAQIIQFSMDMGISNLEDISSLYKDYINESQELIIDIQTVIAEASIIQPDILEKLVHNLKGVSANLYVEVVYQNATLLDNFLKEQQWPFPISNDFILLWQQLNESYKEARNQIIQYFYDNGHDITK